MAQSPHFRIRRATACQLYPKDGTKSRTRVFLQNFAQKVKEIFQHLTGGHKESAALREMKNGVYHYLEGLQDLWDAGFVEILAKGTEEQSGDATEMVEGQGAKYSLREYDQHQIDNWANSKTIEVYNGDLQQVLDFVERSISNKTLRKKLYFGKVSPELATAIYEKTRVHTENMCCMRHSTMACPSIRWCRMPCTRSTACRRYLAQTQNRQPDYAPGHVPWLFYIQTAVTTYITDITDITTNIPPCNRSISHKSLAIPTLHELDYKNYNITKYRIENIILTGRRQSLSSPVVFSVFSTVEL